MRHSYHRGSLSLDFVGTVGARASAGSEERLPDRAELGRWLSEAGLAEGAEPTETELGEARALREAIWAAATDVLDGKDVRRAAVSAINRAAQGLRAGAPQLTASLAVHWGGAPPPWRWRSAGSPPTPSRCSPDTGID
jgi:hypothetical protein